eukprot:1365536-Rhodomonas_salina.2
MTTAPFYSLESEPEIVKPSNNQMHDLSLIPTLETAVMQANQEPIDGGLQHFAELDLNNHLAPRRGSLVDNTESEILQSSTRFPSGDSQERFGQKAPRVESMFFTAKKSSLARRSFTKKLCSNNDQTDSEPSKHFTTKLCSNIDKIGGEAQYRIFQLSLGRVKSLESRRRNNAELGKLISSTQSWQ